MLLRQSQLSLASKQLLKTSRATSTAFRQIPSFSRQPTTSIFSTAPRLAPFSTSTQKKILPPGPQVIEGGVNDPAPVPKSSPIHGSYHWTFERGLSIALVPLTIAPFAAGSLHPATDAVLVFTLILHSHLGFEYVDEFLTLRHCSNKHIGPASQITSRFGNIRHSERAPTGCSRLRPCW